MPSGIVTVGSRRYATGLYWENSPGTGRVAQIAREAAAQSKQSGEPARFFAVRPGNKSGRIPQFGLSGGVQGQEAGMPVLAACLAGQIPGSWAGAFRLNEGIVVVIVRDDLIVPDGDLFFADEAEARDRLIQEIGFGGLQSTYAPEAWSIPSADSIPLTLLLDDRKDIKLQAVEISQKAKIAILGGIVFFAVVVGGVWFWQEKVADDAAAAAAEAERLRMLQNVTQGIPGMPQQTPPEPKYDRVWESKPSPSAVLDACARGLAKIPAAVAGWHITSLQCDGQAIGLQWAREKGMSAPPPGVTLNASGTAGSQNVVLPALHPRGPQDLANPDAVIKRYLMQDWPGTIAEMPDDPPPPPPPNYNGPWNPPPPPWIKRSFTLRVSQFPAEADGLLSGLPGVIVTGTSVEPNSPKSAWDIQGVIYENRK